MLSNALGICGNNEVVSYVAAEGRFKCQPIAVPPSCGTNQVLTYNAAGYQCVQVTPGGPLPTCAPGQFLTYNGTNFICQSPAGTALTVGCPNSQVLVGFNNNQPVCANPTIALPNCTATQNLTSINGTLTCADAPLPPNVLRAVTTGVLDRRKWNEYVNVYANRQSGSSKTFIQNRCLWKAGISQPDFNSTIENCSSVICSGGADTAPFLSQNAGACYPGAGCDDDPSQPVPRAIVHCFFNRDVTFR